ncbi:MAG: LacI family DNA-binding transcriptional regulator [Anaerolineales bacterium]|nr:LacI family DNA-binding transcriptional regulator [Anaerolineales bacterium]
MNKERSQSDNVTIFDVAKEAGVSYSTVSRVINNQKYVKQATRDKVAVAMKKLGYVANLKARSLAGGRLQVIGALIYDLNTDYVVEIMKGIDEEVSVIDYDMIIATTHKRKLKEANYVAKLTRGLVDGLLIVLPNNLEAYIQDLSRQKFPYVLIDHEGMGTISTSLKATNYHGVQEAILYLLELGHKRIGFITGNLAIASGQERFNAYKDTLIEQEVGINPDLICESDFTAEDAYLKTKGLLALPQPPTAIFASCDDAAFGVMDAIREAELRIPQDISVIGFDNIPKASLMTPPLTTVQQPLVHMGRVATRMLIDQIENPEHPAEQVEVETKLILRDSCQPPYESRFWVEPTPTL